MESTDRPCKTFGIS